MIDRETFLDVIDSFDVDYEISHDTRDMILVFIPDQGAMAMQNKDVFGDEIQDAIADAGANIYDVIINDLSDGIQVGIEF